jgi:hypothetical protein
MSARAQRLTRRAGRRRRDERGVVLPTRVMVFSISLVALAGLAFIATRSDDTPKTATPVGSTTVTESDPSPSAGITSVPPMPKMSQGAKAKPEVRRDKMLVAIFNNSNVQGLAGKTGTRAERAGWTVVGTDNWYGTVDTSTVYYGPKLKPAAELLAQDLSINRVKPSVAPMRPDRLTVILTADYR